MFRMRLNGVERDWLETLAARRDLSMSALLRALLKEAYDAALVAEVERTGLDEDELTVLELLAENPLSQDRWILELRWRMKNPFSGRIPMFRKPIGRLKYMGYLNQCPDGYTLSPKGRAAAELRGGWLAERPLGVPVRAHEGRAGPSVAARV